MKKLKVKNLLNTKQANFSMNRKGRGLKVQILTFLLCAGLFVGCSKTANEVSPEQGHDLSSNARIEKGQEVKYDYPEINHNLEKFAISLAAEMSNPEVRALIKAEAMKQFDGDYDILYKNFKNLKMKNGLLVEEHLLKKNKEVKTQAAKIPKFQISVPVQCDSWDTDRHIPLVVIIPQGKGSDEITQLKAIDYKGNIYWLDAKEEPKEPVIVLNDSERTDEEGNLLENLILSNKKGISNGRLENSPEYLGRIYAPDPSELESWYDSKLEMKCIVTVSSSGQAPSDIIGNTYDASRTCISEQHSNGEHGCYFRNFLFTWIPSYGQTIRYTWLEIDGGASESMQISVTYTPTNGGPSTTFSHTISRGSWDKHANLSTVWRGEASNTEYGGGSIFSFRVFF